VPSEKQRLKHQPFANPVEVALAGKQQTCLLCQLALLGRPGFDLHDQLYILSLFCDS
jgi:hypothetical protein